VTKRLISENSFSICGDKVIIAVSDVHLGYYCADKCQFTQFLDDIVSSEDVEHFVLAGDILDMWRRDPLKVFFDNIDIFEKLAMLQTEKRKVHFLAGNHDYHMIELKPNLWEQFNLDVSMDIGLQCGDQGYYFVHGHQFEFADELEMYQEFANLLCMGDDRIGSTADSLWKLYEMGSSVFNMTKPRFNVDLKKTLKSPGERFTKKDVDKIKDKAIEELRKKFEDQIGDRFIVYGHTHRPFVDEERRQANTGSWVDDPNLPMFKKNTYIAIEENTLPQLKEYP
jgi:UDP-2,3-diacylglucosamine pyrophosphatase LpxH